MFRSRRGVVVVAGACVIVIVATLAVVLYWRAQDDRLDDMRDAVAGFTAPAEWVGWTLVEVTSRGYSPFCIDVECPSYSERFVTAVPAGDVGGSLEAAIEEVDAGRVTAPTRDCLAGARCLYTGFTLDVVIADPFDSERGTVPSIPTDFVEVTVTLQAY